MIPRIGSIPQRWRRWLKVIAFPVLVLLIFLLFDRLFPLRVTVPYSQVITSSDGSILQAFLSPDDKWRLYVEPDRITPELETAILFKEDKYFHWHPGVNPVAVVRAAWNNLVTGRRTSGASTITMQVARLLEPAPRTLGSKLRETFRAFQLEWHFSKAEIFRLYLNLVPYGGNVEGIASASYRYFGRTTDQLSLAQIVTLAIVPNRPGSWRPGETNQRLLAGRNRWLGKMRTQELFSEAVIRDALEEPLTIDRPEPARWAPHLTARIHRAIPDQPVVRTTIALRRQQQVQTIVANYQRSLRPYGIHNAAVLVVNNATRAVEAYVGSPDFDDNVHGGQVDGVRAVRSPGSTLKPLVYGIAFDLGLLTPKRIIDDVPVNFGGYAPDNFDEHFSGPVTIEDALARSLNIPAVKTLQQIGLATMIDRMRTAGFEQARHQEKSLGLSLVLGGCGVRLEELTALFAALADSGYYAPLRYLADDSVRTGVPVIGEGAAEMLRDILVLPNRPDLPASAGERSRSVRIAWKTGTSYGRRDGWSIGYNPRYTIGVWVGNFSGEGVPELTGADRATPLLFELFHALDYNSAGTWFKPGKGTDFRLVCKESGQVPSEHCAETVIDQFLPGISSVVRCEHEVEIATDPRGSISYCTSCKPETGYRMQWFPNPAADLARFYDSEQIPYIKIPPHNPACTRVQREQAPVIVSLQDGKEYLIEQDGGEQLPLNAQPANDVRQHYWYVNDRFVGACEPSETVFLKPLAGTSKISCSDDKGRNRDIRISVRFY